MNVKSASFVPFSDLVEGLDEFKREFDCCDLINYNYGDCEHGLFTLDRVEKAINEAICFYICRQERDRRQVEATLQSRINTLRDCGVTLIDMEH